MKSNSFPRERLLMGPGPSCVHPRVLQAMARPTLGHLDPQFLQMMDELKTLLQKTFQTKNELTIPVSGTGSAGMEATFVNVIEPGDAVIVCQNGVFGTRMADVAKRCGAEVTLVTAPWGQAIDPKDVARALEATPDAKLLALVHAETSTGVRQPMEQISKLCQNRSTLLLLDCVTSLGGIPVEIDRWNVDLAYSGTQKCLSCPPGLAPVTVSSKAEQVIRGRKTKVASWYLDFTMLMNYWGGERAYHHTAPINMIYGLKEALEVLHEEGLDQAHARHEAHHNALAAGLEAMGLGSPIQKDERLPQLNVISIPNGVDEGAFRKTLLNDFDIEIGAGLGEFKGKVWRVGLMGHTAHRKNVFTLLGALESTFVAQHPKAIKTGTAIAAANAVYQKSLVNR